MPRPLGPELGPARRDGSAAAEAEAFLAACMFGITPPIGGAQDPKGSVAHRRCLSGNPSACVASVESRGRPGLVQFGEIS